MKFAFTTLLLVSGLALVGCSNPGQPDSARSAPLISALSARATSRVSASDGPPSPDAGFGFNGVVSGFPKGRVFVSGAALSISRPVLSNPREGSAAWRTYCRDR